MPVSWVKDYGEGRVFYTNLGHNEGTWTNPKFLEHVTGGMKWRWAWNRATPRRIPNFKPNCRKKQKKTPNPRNNFACSPP